MNRSLGAAVTGLFRNARHAPRSIRTVKTRGRFGSRCLTLRGGNGAIRVGDGVTCTPRATDGGRDGVARLLAAEAVRHPTWAAQHLWGWIDERLILRFHRRRMAEARRVTLSLDEALERLGAGPARPAPQGVSVRSSVIPTTADASPVLRALLAAIVARPGVETVVEVGVGRGATTAAMLAVMAAQDRGCLWSIELPSLRERWTDEVGMLVPRELRSRWTLVLGPARRVLSGLLRRIGPVDVFVHDGVHAYRNQRADLRTAIPNMRPGGVLVVDDVNNDAFFELFERGFQWFVISQGKEHPIGVAVRAVPGAR